MLSYVPPQSFSVGSSGSAMAVSAVMFHTFSSHSYGTWRCGKTMSASTETTMEYCSRRDASAGMRDQTASRSGKGVTCMYL